MRFLQIARIYSVFTAAVVGLWCPLKLNGYPFSFGIEILIYSILMSGSAVNVLLFFREQNLSAKDLRNWLKPGVLFDVACVLPLSLTALVAFDAVPTAVLSLNLVAVRHIFRVKGLLDEFDSLHPVVYRLVPVLLMLPVLVHWIACGWIALGSGTAGPDADSVMEYIRGLYWAFTTLTTVGYGDIAAKTAPQMLYAAMAQVIGVGVFGYVLSNVAAVLGRLDAAREHHMNNLDRIETFVRNHHVPAHLKQKVRAYYHYLWSHHRGYKDTTLLEDLPHKIQSDLYFFINKNIIEKVPFLKAASRELLEDLMAELEPKIVVPGEKIFHVDEPGDSLYFIQSGTVEIVSRDHQVVATLGEGAFFGEMALLSQQNRSATARAATYCDLYLLHRKTFEQVINTYPEFRKHIEQVMYNRKVA